MKVAELPRDYDSWKLTDYREEREKDMPKILADYHIDQFIVQEVGIKQISEYFEYLDQTYEERYNFENLEIAEHNIVDQEEVDGGIVYTIQIVWCNMEEVIAEDEYDLQAIINKEVDVMWEDDDTIEVKYEIDDKAEYWR